MPLQLSHYDDVWQLRGIAAEPVESPELEDTSVLAAMAAEIVDRGDSHRREAGRQAFQSIIDDNDQLLQQPTIVTNPRGRPRGSQGRRQDVPESSTQRDPSHFEHSEAAAAAIDGQRGRRCGNCGTHGHNRRTCPTRIHSST